MEGNRTVGLVGKLFQGPFDIDDAARHEGHRFMALFPIGIKAIGLVMDAFVPLEGLALRTVVVHIA